MSPPRVPVVLPTWLAGLQWLNVKDFGAKGDGRTDDSAAINAADVQALGAGAVGIDGKTVVAGGAVYFPPGVYRADQTLTYRGAPWYGDGRQVAMIDYRGRHAAIDAVGTDARRKVLRIADLAVRGTTSAPGTMGIRLGHNYRSFGALERVHVQHFPSYGIYFAEDNWLLSFGDVMLEHCGHGGTSGIGMARGVGDVNALDWYNLTIEGCGMVGSGQGGAIHLDAKNGVRGWKFHGGSFEGNSGSAEAVFNGCQQVSLFGVYSESNPATVTDGFVFGDSAFLFMGSYTATAQTLGKAIRAVGQTKGAVVGCHIDARWGARVSVEGESLVTVDGVVQGPTR